MFTGTIKDVGEIKSISTGTGDTSIEIFTAFDASDIEIGSVMSCSGVGLTIVRHGISGGRSWFAVDASKETLSVTSIPTWTKGTKINLEHSLRMGEEIGGHIVTGHVDGVIEVTDIKTEGDSIVFTFKAPKMLMPYIAVKGCVSTDGLSLTVNMVNKDLFKVNITPHMQRTTNFSIMHIGYKANLEIDILARYIARIFGKSEDDK